MATDNRGRNQELSPADKVYPTACPGIALDYPEAHSAETPDASTLIHLPQPMATMNRSNPIQR